MGCSPAGIRGRRRSQSPGGPRAARAVAVVMRGAKRWSDVEENPRWRSSGIFFLEIFGDEVAVQPRRGEIRKPRARQPWDRVSRYLISPNGARFGQLDVVEQIRESRPLGAASKLAKSGPRATNLSVGAPPWAIELRPVGAVLMEAHFIRNANMRSCELKSFPD
jgi:hypothetical protein